MAHPGDRMARPASEGLAMAVDPDVQAKVFAVSGASPDQADDPGFRAATAKAFVAVGIESPAAHLAPVAIFSVGESGLVQSWNVAAEAMFGWSRDEVVGEPSPLAFSFPDADPLRALSGSADGTSITSMACSVSHREGHPVHVLLSATRIRPEHGPRGIVAFATDISSTRESEIAIEEANHRWRHLLMNISDTITIMDRVGRLKETTGEITDILGYRPEQWRGSNGFDFIHPDEQAHAAELWGLLLAHPGKEFSEVLRTRHSDGHYELIEYTATNLFDDPIIDGMVMTTRNVTRERRAEGLLADEARVLELIARDAPLEETLTAITRLVEFHGEGGTAVLLIDHRTHSIQVGAPGSVSERYLKIWRQIPWPPEGLGFDLTVPCVIEDFATDPRTAPFAETASEFGYRGGCSTPIWSNRRNEILGLISTEYSEAHTPTGHEQKVSEVAANLAAIAIERGQWHRELTHQARHHPVTGLPNRTAIREHLDAALARRRGDDDCVAVMFIDLDRFKVVNDSLGHAAGDLLLVRFAGRLSNLVRPGDFVGHFGADGFIVILEGVTDREDVRFVAHRLEVALGEPFALEENEVYVSASIGVAFSEGVDAPDTGDELIQHADAAIYRAKELGRGRLEIFDHAMRRRAGERLRIDRDLRLAIERGEFEVHYQPEIDLGSGSIIGVEALLRWNHPELGLLLPEDFLDVAEDTGVIVSIGAWVIGQALDQARTWASESPELAELGLAVNLSGRQLSSPGLAALIGSLLDHHRWPADHLIVELDESVLSDDREATLDVLNQLRALGVKVAIDDFGTGFSSLSYLHRFPIDIVKIDPSFVVNLDSDGGGSPVVTAIVHMAHALDIIAAAEGVEQPHQLTALRQLGCDRAQGFLFSGAMPAAALGDLLAEGPVW
jgi:diguanylate cyclase (GGDEF)-like protein/PAS domain S-box-containing protein